VVLDDTSNFSADALAKTADDLESELGGRVHETFSASINGFSAEMSEKEAQQLSADPRVKYVEEDGAVDLQATQTDATWGISRIDQPNFQTPLDSTYNYNATGLGVSVYVIDTGILTTHPDFGGRAVAAYDSSHDNTPIDQCDGHGTHVAGTIGSTTYGVAKNVRLYSVKVFPCWGSGTMSNVIAGVDWVTKHAGRPSVVNMSLDGAVSSSLDDAIERSIASGITYVVAAGNYNDDACNYSPSHLLDAIVVGSTDQRDFRDSVSDYGACVDVFAPGVLITSTWNQADSPTFQMSGTSTAAPHVAGVAALYLENHPSASPAVVENAIKSGATIGVVTDTGVGSPNLFLYSLFDSSPSPAGCAGTTYLGTLNSAGAIDYQSSASGFTGASGGYSGHIDSSNGSVFSLALEKQSKGKWSAVASVAPNQILTYNGRSGTYRWRVSDTSGSGNYSLCAVAP
jgi:subtilisin family serine protease